MERKEQSCFLRLISIAAAVVLTVSFMAAPAYAQDDWPDHKMHFPQLPDLIGWDVFATSPYLSLADDWQCSDSSFVTDIHFWGSWKDQDGDPISDDMGTIRYFQFRIWSNLPVGHPQNPYPFSIPGNLLWSREEWVPGTPFDPPTLESWFDPLAGTQVYNDHVPYWRYDFVDIPDPFFQEKNSIYWLEISAVLVDNQNFWWGWKNSRDHFEDDAVMMDPTGMWVELYEPPRYNEFSVTFGPDGIPTSWDGTNFYGDGFYEYEYWWNMWFYDNPFTSEHHKMGSIEFVVDPISSKPYLEFAINWSSPEWDALEMGRPPLPGVEEMYVERQIIGELDLSQSTFSFPIYIEYNPEWISVDFNAVDVIINGSTLHECVGTSLDLAFVITGEEPQLPEFDFGDAPDPTYPTLLASDGARHIIVPNIFLGALIDPEPDGQPDANALGDDNDGTGDEDGVVFTSLLYPGSPAKVKVTASVPGYLDAWMDFNADGDWDDPQEKIFVSQALAAGANDLFYGVPTDAVAGPAISRFRFTTEDTLWKYTGEAPDGEVEDYEVEILEPIGDLKMHYLQPPDLEGWDVLASYTVVVADDWRCTETGPVTEIHFWGSWLFDLAWGVEGFWISIYSNVPGPPYSQPGDELWSAFISDYEVTPMEPFPQGWYDPYYYWWEHPNHQMWFRYDITGIEEPFIQEEDSIYWLSIHAELPIPTQEEVFWGWKTSYEHFEDNAMWGIYDEFSNSFLEPLLDPFTQLPMDMAFAITGGEPVTCGDANNDGTVNLTDAIYLLNYLFRGGAAPIPYMCVGDVNNSDSVNLSDAIYILNYLFKGGAVPNPNCCNPIWAK